MSAQESTRSSGKPTRTDLLNAAVLGPSVKRLFWNKVIAAGPDECWLWRARRDKNGYGEFQSRTICRTALSAPRVAWVITNGPIPDRLLVLHTCDNPPCVNPRHLYLGTRADNMHDCVERGRHRCVPLPGSTNPMAKLTEAQVVEMRQRYAAGVARRILATDYAVAYGTVDCVVLGKTWKHLPVLGEPERPIAVQCQPPPKHRVMVPRTQTVRHAATGEGHHLAKLSGETAREIVLLHRRGFGHVELGHRFGVSEMAIRQVVKRISWRKDTENLFAQ